MNPHFSARLREWLTGPSRLGLLAAAVLLITAVLIALALRPLFGVITPTSSALTQHASAGTSTFEADLKLSLDRINGRSLFFIPPEPPPPPEPVVAREPVDRGPPPPPSRYAGPALVAMVNDTAWFADGRRLTPGDAERDLSVVSLSPPWYATVRWQGAEFNVGLFDRSPILAGGPGPATPAVTPAPPLAPPATPPSSSSAEQPAAEPPPDLPPPLPDPTEPAPVPDPQPHPAPEPGREPTDPADPADPDPDPDPPHDPPHDPDHNSDYDPDPDADPEPEYR